jgi:hypothetical protein
MPDKRDDAQKQHELQEHRRWRTRHGEAADAHKRAADFQERHAAAEHGLGHDEAAEAMEERADAAREREQQHSVLADEEQRQIDRLNQQQD